MDKVTEHNVITGETSSRDITSEEENSRLAKAAEIQARKEAAEAKKLEVLSKLNLTAEEVSALLS